MHTRVQCLQALQKTLFANVSHDFSSFKNLVVSVENLCRGHFSQNATQTEINLRTQNTD